MSAFKPTRHIYIQGDLIQESWDVLFAYKKRAKLAVRKRTSSILDLLRMRFPPYLSEEIYDYMFPLDPSHILKDIDAITLTHILFISVYYEFAELIEKIVSNYDFLYMLGKLTPELRELRGSIFRADLIYKDIPEAMFYWTCSFAKAETIMLFPHHWFPYETGFCYLVAYNKKEMIEKLLKTLPKKMYNLDHMLKTAIKFHRMDLCMNFIRRGGWYNRNGNAYGTNKDRDFVRRLNDAVRSDPEINELYLMPVQFRKKDSSMYIKGLKV